VNELDQEKLAPLHRLNYHGSIADALADIRSQEEIDQVFASRSSCWKVLIGIILD